MNSYIENNRLLRNREFLFARRKARIFALQKTQKLVQLVGDFAERKFVRLADLICILFF